MKALTLWQPWASLWACGAKQYETRSWTTSYRGPIAIHAAIVKPSRLWHLIESIVGAVRKVLRMDDLDDLPRGKIIAIADLVEIHEIKSDALVDEFGTAFIGGMAVSYNELLFGDWTPGRYAWEIKNVKMLDKPIPAKGKQGLWNWEGQI